MPFSAEPFELDEGADGGKEVAALGSWGLRGGVGQRSVGLEGLVELLDYPPSLLDLRSSGCRVGAAWGTSDESRHPPAILSETQPNRAALAQTQGQVETPEDERFFTSQGAFAPIAR